MYVNSGLPSWIFPFSGLILSCNYFNVFKHSYFQLVLLVLAAAGHPVLPHLVTHNVLLLPENQINVTVQWFLLLNPHQPPTQPFKKLFMCLHFHLILQLQGLSTCSCSCLSSLTSTWPEQCSSTIMQHSCQCWPGWCGLIFYFYLITYRFVPIFKSWINKSKFQEIKCLVCFSDVTANRDWPEVRAYVYLVL